MVAITSVNSSAWSWRVGPTADPASSNLENQLTLAWTGSGRSTIDNVPCSQLTAFTFGSLRQSPSVEDAALLHFELLGRQRA